MLHPKEFPPSNPIFSPISQPSNGFKLVSAPTPTDGITAPLQAHVQVSQGESLFLAPNVSMFRDHGHSGIMDIQSSGKVPGDRIVLGAEDKRDLTQFVTSNVRRVINPSEMGIHHRDQPELCFGKGPIFDFSQLNPSGPTLGTISASHPTAPPWHQA